MTTTNKPQASEAAMTYPTRSLPFSISSSCAASLLRADDDWQLVVKFAHYSSDFAGLLERAERAELVLLADGFGDLRGYRGRGRADMLADWSHVRDSSPEAVERMASWIKGWVAKYSEVTR
jgi:hypothetical protein